jgi:hypothetical protein
MRIRCDIRIKTTPKSCWKICDDDDDELGGRKGGRGRYMYVGSADGGFVPESKLIFRSKSESNTDYHRKMDAEVFKKWFQEQFCCTLPLNIIVMDNASCYSVMSKMYPVTGVKEADIAGLSSKKYHSNVQNCCKFENIYAV